jgi:hypothetical protein
MTSSLCKSIQNPFTCPNETTNPSPTASPLLPAPTPRTMPRKLPVCPETMLPSHCGVCPSTPRLDLPRKKTTMTRRWTNTPSPPGRFQVERNCRRHGRLVFLLICSTATLRSVALHIPTSAPLAARDFICITRSKHCMFAAPELRTNYNHLS